MTTKQRITKLENSQNTTQAQEDSFKFTHEVREDGDRFYIDGVEVESTRYGKEHADDPANRINYSLQRRRQSQEQHNHH